MTYQYALRFVSTLFLLHLLLLETFCNGKKEDYTLSKLNKTDLFQSDVLLIGIDESSLVTLEDSHGSFPWERDVYAKLIRFLRNKRPALLFFDFYIGSFKNRQKDQELFSALKNANFPVFFSLVYADATSQSALGPTGNVSYLNKISLPNVFDPSPKQISLDPGRILFPLPEILSNAKASLASFGRIDASNSLIPLVYRVPAESKNLYIPSIHVLISSIVYKMPPQNIKITLAKEMTLQSASVPMMSLEPAKTQENSEKINRDYWEKGAKVRIKDITIPIDLNGVTYVNLQHKHGSFAYRSFSDIILNKVEDTDELFQNRIVICGFFTQSLEPGSALLKKYLYTTPIGKLYGIEIHANIIKSLLSYGIN